MEKTPPYSPREALKTFRLPEGFRIELVAAEPEVVDPVAMAFDAQGRLFVVEMRDYPMEAEPRGKIRLLEDPNGDGRYEKSTVFAEGLHLPSSVMPWKEGILVTAAPHIFYLADTDGDNHVDEKRIVLTGFNPYNPQLRVNGLLYAMDNWIYGAYPKVGPSRLHPEQFGRPGEPVHFPDHPEVPALDLHQLGTDFRFRPDLLKLESAAGNSQFGNTFDAAGNRFTLWNSNHIRHVVVENRYLARNPYQGVASAMHFPSDHKDQSIVYPVTENPIYIHESQFGMVTSACGNSVYTGGNFPHMYEGAYFVCEPVHNLVHSDFLIPRGATFVAKRALQEAEFLASSDPWFKPVFTTVGPEGALYVVDYYRKYVEHPDYVPEGMEGRFDLREGEDRGRIYRVLHETSRPTPKPQLQEAASAELVKELSNPNMWWRISAQRLLVERQDQSIVPALRELTGKAPSAEGRIHALWTLQGLGRLEADLVLQALDDESPLVRQHAIRLSEGVLSDSIQRKLLKMTEGRDDRVLFQLACTLGMLPDEKSFQPLKKLLTRYLDDSWFQVAVLSAASKTATRWFRVMTGEKGFLEKESKGKEEFLQRTAAIVGARQKVGEIAEILTLVDGRNEETGLWWRTASLKGLAEGLKRGSEGRISLSAAAQHTLVQLLEASSPPIVAAALEVATNVQLSNSPQLRASLHKAAQIALNTKTNLQLRVNGVRLLGLDPTGSSIRLLGQLFVPQQPLKVQVAAATALVEQGSLESLEVLLEEWGQYALPVREVLLRGFFNNTGHLHALLDAVEDERVMPWTLSRIRINQLIHSREEDIRRRAEVLFDEVAQSDRRKVIEKYRPALSMKGDIERGKEAFKLHCKVCHRVGEMGFEVGPDLLNLSSRWSKGFLLTDIIDPNANIAPGYEEYVIETKDGRTITGVIVEDGATAVILRRREDDQDTVLRHNIASLRATTASTMPEGLEDEIGISQMADLLEYLQAVGQGRE